MPDRSVSVVVDEAVERGIVRAVLDLNKGGFVVSESGRRDIRKHLGSAAGYLDYPAMVEALVRIAGSVDYEPSDDEIRRVGREWFVGFNDARQRAAEIARAVLGGEVQGGSDVAPLGERDRVELQRLRQFASYVRGYCSAGPTDEDRHLQEKAEVALGEQAASTSTTTTEETSS